MHGDGGGGGAFRGTHRHLWCPNFAVRQVTRSCRLSTTSEFQPLLLNGSCECRNPLAYAVPIVVPAEVASGLFKAIDKLQEQQK